MLGPREAEPRKHIRVRSGRRVEVRRTEHGNSPAEPSRVMAQRSDRAEAMGEAFIIIAAEGGPPEMQRK